MNTQLILDQILQLKNQKVTFFSIDSMAMIYKIEGKIIDAKISEYAQYSDGIAITYRGKRKRKDDIIRCYRGASWEDKNGTIVPRGKELIIVPQWNIELRNPSEELSTNVPNIKVFKLVGLDSKSYPIVIKRAKAIANSVIFELNE